MTNVLANNDSFLLEGRKPVVLLWIQNAQDRRLIKKYLSDQWVVNVGDNGIANKDFDLCILDEQSFDDNKEYLQQVKEEAAPIFLPYLLLSPSQQTVRMKPDILDFADDVVYIPASKKLLKTRINMLLRQREYSLELEAKNRQLKEKNDKLRVFEQAIDSTKDGVLITDLSEENNPIIYCNEGFERLTGYSQEDVVGHNCRFLQGDDRDQAARQEIRSIIENRENGQVRLRNYRRDGTMFWNELSLAPINNEGRGGDFFVGVLRDVTELVETQQQLQEEKERYRLIAENATDMISLHAPDGTYLYASPASQDLIGCEPEELVGQNAYDNMHPEDRERILNENDIQFAKESVVRWTFRKQTKDQGYKWVEATMRPIRDDNGEVIEIQASTRDISARKEYERKLEEEKDFINASIESLPELFFLIDENQNFVKWNNIEQELGYTDEDVQDMHPLDFYREEDHEFITSKINKAFTSGNAEAEVQMQAKNGELIPYYIKAKHFSRGDENYIVGSCINLSDIKEAQYELEQHRQLLDAIINQTKSLIYLKDEDRKYRLVNDSYLEFYNLKWEEVLGKTDLEVHGKEFLDHVGETDYRVLKADQASEIEEMRFNGDGERRIYHTIKYPLKGVPGFENCMCGISTDITDLKQATQQLQERIKELRCLFNVSKLTEHHSNIAELLDEAVTYLPDGMRYPEITQAAIEFDGDIYQTKGYRETDWMLSSRSVREEGKSVHAHIAYTESKTNLNEAPFSEEEKQLIDGIVETLSSQIDRMYAREKLKESQKRWKGLVENDPDLIQTLKRDGTIIFINQSGASILGFDTPKEVIGKNYLDLIEVDDEGAQLTQSRIEQVINGKKIPAQIYKIKAVNDRQLYLESQAVPITLDTGEPGIQQVAQDVTDRIMYEEELKQSLKEKETLLQEIHHRVKNNLAVVSGMMELQTFNTENKEVKSLLSDSTNRIKTMALIHEKLYQSESLSEINFGSYIRDLVTSIEKISPDDNISLEFDCDAFSLNINQAVPTALIVNEIILNAYEHAFEEGERGHIKISMKQEQGQITVCIRDNGRGLSSDFNHQKNDSIGFTIIETLVKQLQADIDVSSEEGLSIIFSFEKQDIKGSSSALI